LLTVEAGCGAGKPTEPVPIPSTFDVRVSAGGPVAGATVTVYAISDATGQVNNSAGAGGVLGSAGPTDAAGKALVSVRPYAGPVQIVAGGPAMAYPDPTLPPDSQGVVPTVQVPAAFLFTTYLAEFRDAPVPVTLFATLADHAALAYARGLHLSHPSKTTITEALAARDPLFVTHITKAAASWRPDSLRRTVPVPLTQGPQSLVDSAFAAIFDVALNQLARDTAAKAGYGSGGGGLTAPTLLQLLEDDIDADGRLDGLGFGGRTIATGGVTPVVMDAQFLRRPLAVALAAWSRNAQVNKSGISDADLVGAQVFKTILEDDSDLFGPAPTLAFDPLDRTPPEISLAAPLPRYTSSRVPRLLVNVQDPSGVKALHTMVGAQRLDGQLVDGTWQVDLFLPAVGSNAVTIWAEDLAEPASNSGLGAGAAHQIDLDITFDPVAPQALYDSAYASYSDERGLTVGVGVDGLAVVPAAYTTGARVPIPVGGKIFKAATRLSAGGPLDVAELEGPNAANIPVLRFAVPFNASTDSPVTRAEFNVAVSCPGCGPLEEARGALLPSPTTSPQVLLYDLPLSLETVPALGAIVGPASLSVSLDLADAAGNSAGAGPFAFVFHAIGPPIALVEDAAYRGYGDPRSTFPYRIRGMVQGIDTYSTLFDPSSPAFYGGQVRLARFILSNPSPSPVAVRPAFIQSPGGSWRATETWLRQSWVDQPAQFPRDGPGTATARSIDGFAYSQATYWATPYGTAGRGLPNTETAAHPCGGPGMGTPAHRMGDRATRWTCLPDSVWTTPTTDVFATSPVAAVAYAGPQQGGGEVVPPGTDGSGTALVVPGAVGAAPGALVLYLTRPVAAARTRPLQMNLIGNMNLYETWDYEAALLLGTWASGTFVYDAYSLYKSGEYLQAATENLEGSVSISTQGLVDAGLFGEPASQVVVDVSRTVASH
jgi:hypothetical protein